MIHKKFQHDTKIHHRFLLKVLSKQGHRNKETASAIMPLTRDLHTVCWGAGRAFKKTVEEVWLSQ